MLRSMYAGVSGLRNHQTRLDVIGNNIANVNTIGFKSSRVTFKDLFSQTLRAATSAHGDRGGSNPVQVGLGMTLASIDTNHTDGSINYTGYGTDLAIEGSGFFIIRDGNTLMYTRAGNFDVDEEGYLVVPGTGLRVQGLDGSADGRLTDIRISTGETFNPVATTELQFANNLDVEAADNARIVNTVEVYDSLGRLHLLEMAFVKLAGTNAWNWSAYSPLTAGINLTGNLDENGTYPLAQMVTVTDAFGKERTIELEIEYDGTDWTWTAFDEDRNTVGTGTGADLASLNGTITVDGQAIALNFDGMTTDPDAGNTLSSALVGTQIGNGVLEFDENGRIKDSSAQGTITLTPALAGSPQEVTLDFGSVTGAAGESSVAVSYRNGAPQGSLKSYSIDGAGNVVGEFSNGLIRTIGQVALARFANPGGLTKVGNTSYIESNNSGLKQIGQAGTSGFGSIAPSSLEMSNVDLSLEFTEMIVTQRGLQANSRIITTSDEVLQEIVNLKR